MKKIICLLTVLVLCAALAAPAFAAEEFVPSIAYKPQPEIVPVVGEDGREYVGVIRDEDGEIIRYVSEDFLAVTSLALVMDPDSGISQTVRELLKNVYDDLSSGSMELPYDKFGGGLDAAKMVIRDLVEVSWASEEYARMLEAEGVTFEITLDLGLDSAAEAFIMTYDALADTWEPIVSAVNNGDGTVTCTFEHLCVVAISVPAANPGITGGSQAPGAQPWTVILILAVIGLAVMMLFRNRKTA